MSCSVPFTLFNDVTQGILGLKKNAVSKVRPDVAPAQRCRGMVRGPSDDIRIFGTRIAPHETSVVVVWVFRRSFLMPRTVALDRFLPWVYFFLTFILGTIFIAWVSF